MAITDWVKTVDIRVTEAFILLVLEKDQALHCGLMQSLIPFAMRSSADLDQCITGYQYFDRKIVRDIYFFHREYAGHHPQGYI